LKIAVARASTRRAALSLALATLTLLPLACAQSGPEMASVSGKVTYNGNPVPKGTITFQAVDSKGRNATGAIQPDGSYTLQTEQPADGAQLGEYRVAISARDDVVLDYLPPKPIPPKRLAPEKYENPQTSGLTASVKSGRNTFPFDLK
jgi:hypothetical protein